MTFLVSASRWSFTKFNNGGDVFEKYQWAVILVGLVLGIMLAAQYRVTREIQASEAVQRAQELSAQVEKLKIERDSFQKRVDELRSQLDQVNAGPQVSEIKEALEHAIIEAGVSEVKRPPVSRLP